MSEPTNDFNPPFPDLVEAIKEARRHASAFQKAPLRREQLRQLYMLADKLRFLMASDPNGKKPLPDGRSPIPMDDLLVTKLAGPDFDPLRPRFDDATGPEHHDDERAANLQRHNETIKAHYDLWTDPRKLKELGLDAATIDMLRTKNNATERTKLLFDLVEREIDLLEPDPLELPNGLQWEEGLMWANVLELNEKLAKSAGRTPIPSTVSNSIPPATAKLESEKRIAERRPQRITRATKPIKKLYEALQGEAASISRQSFSYYGAAAEFDRLAGSAQSQDGVMALTACIVAARKVNRGRAVYEQDQEIFRAVLQHIRDMRNDRII